MAAEIKETKDWRYCSTDEHCVVVDGLCDKTAVNWQRENQAIAFYNAERKNAKCVERFWRPKNQDVVARCRVGGCETIPKQHNDADK